MLRSVAAAIVLGLASVASAQVIYLPPPQIDIYNPYYEKLDPQAVARLRVLSEPRVFIQAGNGYANYISPYGYFTGYVDVYGNPLVAVQPPLEQGIDPQTGQALYFRKKDLLPVPVVGPEEPGTAPQSRPQTAPTTRPAMGPTPPGTIIITPHKAPAGGMRVVSR